MGQERGVRFRRRMVGGRRPHVTKIAHSDEEWARVQAMATAMGISVPRLYERALRVGDAQAVLKISRLVDEVRIIERVMSKTAVNINQIAVVANATGEVSAPQIAAAARHLDAQVMRVIELLEEVTGEDRFERSTVPLPGAVDSVVDGLQQVASDGRRTLDDVGSRTTADRSADRSRASGDSDG